MGLRISDALELSWLGIARYKGRSAAIVITVAVLFGLVMGVNLLLDGLEKTLLAASVENTDGKIYVETDFQKGRYGTSEVRLAERLEKYGGKKVGKVRTWDLWGMTMEAIDMGVVEEFVDEETLLKVPEGKIPVLMPEGGLEEAPRLMDGAEEIESEISEKFFVVGEYPVTERVDESGVIRANGSNAMWLADGNWLGFLVSEIYGNQAGYWPLLIDDGSGRIGEYIAEKVQQEREMRVMRVDEMLMTMEEDEDGDAQEYTAEDVEALYEEARTWDLKVRESSVAVFEDYEDVKRYVLTRDTPEARNLEPRAFMVKDLFSNTVQIVEAFDYYRMLMRFFEVVLLVVAVIVAALSFAHLIDSDVATVALYRSMGASTGEIYLIYGLYLVELCLLAVVGSVVMALGLVGVVVAVNAEGLAVGVQEFYGLKEMPKVWLVGFGGGFWRVVLMIMLVAPVTLVLMKRRFATKYIAKKLKDEQ